MENTHLIVGEVSPEVAIPCLDSLISYTTGATRAVYGAHRLQVRRQSDNSLLLGAMRVLELGPGITACACVKLFVNTTVKYSVYEYKDVDEVTIFKFGRTSFSQRRPL